MNNKARGEKVRMQILADVTGHPSNIARHISQIFSITPQAVNRHLKRLENENRIQSTGTGKGKKYFLGDLREFRHLFRLTEGFTEDEVWRNHYAFIFEGLPENIVDICHFGFTEMVNNVIDHSDGSSIFVAAKRNLTDILIYVMDDGEGIFKKIRRLCNFLDERQALLELSKGKLTTDPENHTGEGIFFTSRVFDEFNIDSRGVEFSHDIKFKSDFIDETGLTEDEVGTVVYMKINRNSTRDMQTIFDEYAAPDSFQFNKTVIPVRLAQYGNEKLISRSQAKRLLARLERFENVIFDFTDVTSIGQAFADEIFRVYANNHPDIQLVPVYMQPNVEKMVIRAVASSDSLLNQENQNHE